MRWRLAAAGTLIGLALCELLLRLAGPWLPVDLTTRALQELHPVYGVFHRPGASAWIRDPEFKTFVRFNREGLRGPEIPSSPAPGVTRVLVLGDSFVEGAEVEEDQTLPSVMAKRLTEAGFAAEALNGGVRGWGTAQEYLYLTDQGLALHPDIVVLVLYVGNDLVDNSVELSGLAPDGTFSRPFFVLDRGQLVQLPAIPALASAIDPLLHVARSHFTLVNFLESAVAVRLAYADRAEVLRSVHRLVFADPPPTQWEQAWAVTEAVSLGSDGGGGCGDTGGDRRAQHPVPPGGGATQSATGRHGVGPPGPRLSAASGCRVESAPAPAAAGRAGRAAQH